jgi:hypothetical protein
MTVAACITPVTRPEAGAARTAAIARAQPPPHNEAGNSFSSVQNIVSSATDCHCESNVQPQRACCQPDGVASSRALQFFPSRISSRFLPNLHLRRPAQRVRFYLSGSLHSTNAADVALSSLSLQSGSLRPPNDATLKVCMAEVCGKRVGLAVCQSSV